MGRLPKDPSLLEDPVFPKGSSLQDRREDPGGSWLRFIPHQTATEYRQSSARWDSECLETPWGTLKP